MTRRLAVVPIALTLAALTACNGQPASAPATARAASGAVSSAAPQTSARSSSTAPASSVSKVLVFVVENHSLAQMRKGMPWVDRVARRYGYATRYHAITHPSLPNYLAIAGGSTFGVADDDPPSAHPLTGSSVFGRAVAAGATATTYAEGMTSRCQTSNEGRYAVRHNPWTYFTNERRACRRHDVSLDHLADDVAGGDLPAVGLAIPDVCNDAHDCSLRAANRWMRRYVGDVLAGPDFTSGDLAVVITADEDDRHHGNRVLTVVAQQSLHHQVVRTALTHYSLARSLADVAGVRPLRHARKATSLLKAFGLTPSS